MKHSKATIFRVILFCLGCAIALAAVSGIVQSLSTKWNQHVMLIIVIVIIYGLTVLFAKWEKLPLKQVGVVAGAATVKKVIAGFVIGLMMALLQPLLVFVFGHYRLSFTHAIDFPTLLFFLSLYILVAIREELAFRGYPLFSLNYQLGLWPAQVIILIIFSLEHIAGGMRWFEAFLGAGTGAILFGLAAIKSKGIALPVGIHTAWNFGQWCMGLKKETGIMQGIADKGFENVVEKNAWISYFLVMTIGILCFYLYKPKVR